MMLEGGPAGMMEHYAAAAMEEDLGAVGPPRHPMPVFWGNDPWVHPRTARTPTTLAGKLFIKVERSVEVCGRCNHLMKHHREGGPTASAGSSAMSSRVYLSMELDGYSRDTPVTRGLSGDWGATLSLDVVEYYGPSMVQVGLWESRIWGQDQFLGRFSFPLSDGVVVCSSSSSSSSARDEAAVVLEPPTCTCYQASTETHSKVSFPARAREVAAPTAAAVSLPPPSAASSSSSSAPSPPQPPSPAPTACCLPSLASLCTSTRRRRASSTSIAIEPPPPQQDESRPPPPFTPTHAGSVHPGGAGPTAEELLQIEMATLRGYPASRRQWYMVKPVGRGPRVAYLLDIQYLPLKSCTAISKETGVNDLQMAALLGKTEVVEAIIRDIGWSSVSCSARTASGYTALDYAILRGDLKSVTLLLEYAAERFFQEAGPLSPSPLHMAVRCHNISTLSAVLNSLRLVSIGLESSMLAHRDEEGRTPLALACALGHLEAAQALIKRFADPAARDLNKNTPLHLASRYGHIHIVKFLLALRGAGSSTSSAAAVLHHDLFMRGNSSAAAGAPAPAGQVSSAALAAASAAPRAPLACMAALPCAFNADGDTALLLAARYGHVDIAKALLKKGVPAIDENKEGRTALHEAALGGHSGIIRLFVDHLLNILRRKENRRRPSAELRLAAGWLMAQDIHGKSPLSLAMAKGHREVAALLVASAMEVNSMCGVRPAASLSSSHKSSEGGSEGESEEEDYCLAFDVLNEQRPPSSASSHGGSSSSTSERAEESEES